MSDNESEAEILHPERELTLKGEQVTVNEITFLQGMKLQETIKPMLADLSAFFLDGEDEEAGSYEDLQAIFAKHSETFLSLLELTTDRPAEWLAALNDIEGRTLSMAFWTVNKDFFINRLLVKQVEKTPAAELEKARAAALAESEPGSVPSTPH